MYWAIAISGLCALGAEVVWTRILALMLGPTTYTFSIILGVFLVGLGLGSGGGFSIWPTRKARPACGWGSARSFFASPLPTPHSCCPSSLPYWAGNLNSAAGPWKDFLSDIWRCTVAIFPAAVLWGASFPLALASVDRGNRDPARVVGGIYGANTVGAILGSLLFSLVLIPSIGTLGSQQLLVVLSALRGSAGAGQCHAESRAENGRHCGGCRLSWHGPCPPFRGS